MSQQNNRIFLFKLTYNLFSQNHKLFNALEVIWSKVAHDHVQRAFEDLQGDPTASSGSLYQHSVIHRVKINK